MSFTDPVSSISGRNSRASNVSNITGASQSVRSQPAPRPQNDTLASAAVLSMLKTTTDTGDIGALSFNNSRLPTMPRATHQKRGHHPRLSGLSNPTDILSHHHYAPSQISKVSSSRDWETISNQRRGSLTSMASMPPSLPPAHLGKSTLQMPSGTDGAQDSRSYSMTSAPTTQHLDRRRSATSLTSQGHEQRHLHSHPHPGQQPPMMPDNRPPYVYPTRLKRPGYRSPSPALSDTYSQGTTMPVQPPMGRRMPMPPRPPPQGAYGDYPASYGDPRHLNGGPPPRGTSVSPISDYAEAPPSQYPYRNPAAMRSAPGLSMPHHPQPGPSTIHRQPLLPLHPHQPMMQRSVYPGMPYPPRPGCPPYAPMQHPGYRGPPPPPAAAPMAHHMFHNAARMVRQMPQRSDTPMTESGPPSSDPPSSGTAPSSSSPPTPRDQTSITVAVDPAFIDPALVDLEDSTSEPVFAHQYLRYAEGLEKDVDDSDIEIAHPSVPPTGFVQRVRAMLESKAATDAAATREIERGEQSNQMVLHTGLTELDVQGESDELHELAANETPRFTIIEEYNAPVELPASPVRLPELGGSPVQHRRRITREIIKAELDPSADNSAIQTEDVDTSTSIDIVIHHKASRSQDAGKLIGSCPETEMVNEDEPNTPETIRVRVRDEVKSDSVAASSPATLGLSAVEYAMRFDSTTTSEETQSKDPFALDADTITLQHQRSKEKDHQPQPTPDRRRQKKKVPQTDFDGPVSPVLSAEDVGRCSAVSPLHTQTLGIDETIEMTSEQTGDDTNSFEESTMPSAFPEDTHPPPTPKTPKTYSKSVQLPPSTTVTDTPNSNRYSLPPDLSTVGDTTVNSTSDMITDVAVRFSLPQTTVTVSKPAIIEIPPTSSPERDQPSPQSAPKPAKPARAKRGSVTFADEVAPLKISKRPEPQPSSQKSSEAKTSQVKSIVRRPSPQQESGENNRVSRDSTTDLRFSGMNPTNGRFGSTHLPRLKEESIEEMSISDRRGPDGTYQFPLPARIAAVKAMQERRLQESAEKAKARRAHRHPNRPLADTRDLPSLNFSRMDLIDKLNEALEVRESRSMEVIRRREFSGIYCPSPQRPQSTEPLRERYMSFFSKPEDFSAFFDDVEEGDTTQDISSQDTDTLLAPDQGVPTVEVEPNTEIEGLDTTARPLSPEEFLKVATQVNRLSIPSVTGLSERLSELLPNLRDLQLESVLSNFGDVVEDIHVLGAGLRPETVLSTRTSAGFRTLAERAEEIVKNGTHDSFVPIAKLLAENKDLPPLTESMSADMASAIPSINGMSPHLSGSVSAPGDLRTDIVRPVSALTRHKSPTSEDEVRTLLPPEMNPIARNAKRAIVISSGSSRPWNQEENYPWAGSKVDFDLTVPSQAHARNSVASEIIRKRRTKSLDLTSSGEPTATTKGIDIGSILEHDPTASPTSQQLTGVSVKPPKHSVIGSITRKMRLGSKLDANTTSSIPSPAVLSDAGRNSSLLPHRPGERYPTSSLTPPAGFNLDEVRSFFSDNSSEKERHASLRKRLTNFKGKNKNSRIDYSRGQSLDDNTTYDAGEGNMERLGAASSANTFEGVGMGKTEFRIKRFGEKLRHLMAKGGELIRSLSQRSKAPKTERVREDWLSDSLYSGV